MIYPWQQTQWKRLISSHQSNRLPHALLLSGIAGTGKSEFADTFSRALLCEKQSASGEPCDHCHACRTHLAKAHPDMLWVSPEKEGQAIKVDQIREVTDFANQSSFEGGARIILIQPANAMNLSAANALLKTLEEPPSGALMLLVLDQSARLPATIVSRCQRITFSRPTHAEAMAFLKDQIKNPELILKLSHGAPLKALALAKDKALLMREELYKHLSNMQDPVQSASHFKEVDSYQWLDFFISWLVDLLKLQIGEPISALTNIDFEAELSLQKNKYSTGTSTQLLTHLMQLRRELANGIHHNKLLMVEDLFIRWSHAT